VIFNFSTLAAPRPIIPSCVHAWKANISNASFAERFEIVKKWDRLGIACELFR